MSSCTTILVGKKASYDGSTMIARNEDSPSGIFWPKKLSISNPETSSNQYKSKISNLTIELPKNPLKHVYFPKIDLSEGVWGGSGINSKNVAITATETITSNERVLGADPLIDLSKEENKGKYGIGEEDFVLLVIPFINTAREGVKRVGELLEKYGTYEPNGMAFSDENEIWWLETIGGHHFIAKKVPDDKVVIMPNQFGLDNYDLNDALGAQENHICSSDLLDFIKKNHLNFNQNEKNFNPRIAFGSHTDFDHVYNTPRAWYLGRYLAKKQYKWDGPNADYKPDSDNIPWSYTPDNLITIEDVKYLLSSHFQGTPYDPYSKGDNPLKNKYRVVGINRTGFVHICQIRGYMNNNDLKPIIWFSFGACTFNTLTPFYTNVNKVPEYYSNTTLKANTNNFYWQNRLIAALADSQFSLTAPHIERYQLNTMCNSHQIISKYDNEYKNDTSLLDKANQEIADMIQELTDDTLNKVLFTTSCHMKTAFFRNDN